MVLVTLRQGNKQVSVAVGGGESLADVQREICHIFSQSFPAMKATVSVGGKKYDEFVQTPFRSCSEGEVIEVSFSKTDDPFFYDVADRKGRKRTLEEEMLLEEAGLPEVPPFEGHGGA